MPNIVLVCGDGFSRLLTKFVLVVFMCGAFGAATANGALGNVVALDDNLGFRGSIHEIFSKYFVWPARNDEGAQSEAIDRSRLPIDSVGVKWHPGHYVLLILREELAGSQVMTELANNGVLRGVQKRYAWADLEPNKGQYDFSKIKRDLDLMRGIGKQLVVQIQTKSAFDKDLFVPLYVRAPEYGGGVFHKRAGGYNLTLWNAALRDRLISLARAMGAALNDDPALEAVNLDETAINVPSQPMPVGYDEVAFIDNLLAIDRELRVAFPNTVVIQYANYPRTQLPKIVSFLKQEGIGLGGPDVFTEDSGLLGGVYQYYPQLSGVVPLAPAVQWENYTAKFNHGPHDPQSARSIYYFARDRLKANYVFWLRRVPTRDDATNYWGQVLKFLNEEIAGQDPAGGLASKCPSVYARCI